MPLIPTKNADFVAWAIVLAAQIEVSNTDYGVTVAEATELASRVLSLQSSYASSTSPATRTSLTIQQFNNDRAAVEEYARFVNAKAQAVPATSVQLLQAGLPVRDGTRSPQQPVSASIELGIVKAIPECLVLSARCIETPTSKAKPAGTGAVEIALAIGEVSAITPEQATERRFYTKTPLSILTNAGQRGKVCTVFARYESKGTIGGVKVYGPWSTPLEVRLP